MGEQPPERVQRAPRDPARPRNPLADNAPWKPAAYDIEVAGAFRALAAGTAQPQQQKLALDWLINIAAGTYDEAYRPGEEGRRDTDYALGKQYVGRQVVKMIKLNPATLKRR